MKTLSKLGALTVGIYMDLKGQGYEIELMIFDKT
jgi:hypothetical protein